MSNAAPAAPLNQVVGRQKPDNLANDITITRRRYVTQKLGAFSAFNVFDCNWSIDVLVVSTIGYFEK